MLHFFVSRKSKEKPDDFEERNLSRGKMIYEMLAHIKKRPGMYLGKPSMSALGYYVHGFEHAIALAHIPPQEDDKEFEHFKKWLAKEFHGANLGWNGQILLLVSGNDPLWWRKDEKLEEQALKRFFALLEQYNSGLLWKGA